MSHGSQSGSREAAYGLQMLLIWPLCFGPNTVFKSNVRRQALCFITPQVVPVTCQRWVETAALRACEFDSPGRGFPVPAQRPNFLLLRWEQLWLVQAVSPCYESHMARAARSIWLVAMGMKTQMLLNHRTIISTSKTPRCATAGGMLGLACSNQSPLPGSQLKRRWHFSMQPH